MKDYIPIISVLIGILFGGSLQYLLARLAKKREGFEKLQSDAYVDFMRGMASLVMAQQYQDPKAEMTAASLMLEAKIRIGIYGAPSIAQAVGEFFEKYSEISKPEDKKAFVNLMHKMRSSVIGPADEKDWIALSRILFSQNLNA